MDDLRQAMQRRKTWLYETQLRRLNYEAFRSIRPDGDDPRLDIISEQLTVDFGRGPSGRLKDAGRVYRDSREPVWSADDEARHGEFAASLIGRMGDWLGACEPRRIAAALAALRAEYEASPFASATDPLGSLGRFGRSPAKLPTEQAPAGEGVGSAIARAELAAGHPWLVAELYNVDDEDVHDPRHWVANLERYVDDFEVELGLAVGGGAGVKPPLDPAAPALYRAFIRLMLAAGTERPASDAVKVRVLERAGWSFRPSLQTNGSPLGPVTSFTLSKRVKYWAGVVHNSLKECVGLKPNSDMGLCQLVRLLYRYGPLPQSFGAEEVSRWRARTPPSEAFVRFLDRKAADPAVAKDPELAGRLHAAATRLRIVLEETAANPHAADPSWSPLAGEILKQGLLSYKFWLDERPRAKDNDRLNQVKKALGFEDEADREMEFWSENHYIMFASSEYLLGQLWEHETFQPGRAFADANDRTGARPGTQRRERGRARVLRWLNNRLMFGWTEFNSSGYYREHLWALLNLVDFALDEEVRTKATMAVDLMLFDVVRFLHRGAMGAAGGRSQFKSKSHGFDNGLTDVVEIMFGAKGVFSEGNAEIAASFSSSTYAVPDVLLEIGAHPPNFPFTDRTRVSVTFDEAAKYGITWSQKSVVKDSLLQGYAAKRARHFPHLAQVNREIERTHDGYGRVEDDTVFFWGMSAFFNQQVVRNTLHVIHRFGLEKAEAFGPIRWLVETILPIVKAPESSVLGFSLTDLPARAVSLFTAEDHDELDEEAADDLSLVLEGSTRTRANIVTYRSPGAMLSSIQNFRYGQLNFQSSVQQATLGGAVNVFVTAGFAGLDISDLAAFGAGALIGGLAFGPIGAIAGGVGAVVANHELVDGMNPLDPHHNDGPDWWTGYWALPRVLQHRGAAILLSEFHDIQDFLAETGTHAWFPKSGFDRVVERRTSAYDDANFPLLDIGHIGAKGFWLFGKVVHPPSEGSTDEPEEGYVGVFSNKRPEWLTKDSDPYERRLEEKGDDGIWKDPPDLFADKDWYVNGKNIWIVQVGSRSEFGSFDAFTDRVTSARVHVDDVGDLECTYDVPLPGGGSSRLRITNGDAEFELDGRPLETDRFPRFENPFVRGGLVEWGQRAYCLEWNGRRLLHDFRDFRRPRRDEAPKLEPEAAETILALVIYLRTGEEAMDAFTVASATVEVGCQRVCTSDDVAVGPVPEDTSHDAEWIFLDRAVKRRPDMTVTLSHRAVGREPLDLNLLDPRDLPDFDPKILLGPLALLGGIGDPEWEATFSLKALMGDWTIRDCSVPFPGVDVEGNRRGTGLRPFAVRLGRWARWEPVPGAVLARRWMLARQPPASALWLDHHDIFAVDRDSELWHKRATCGMEVGAWVRVALGGAYPAWSRPFAWAAASVGLGRTALFVVSDGRLVAAVSDDDGRFTGEWRDLQPSVPGFFVFREPVPLGPGSAVTATPSDDPLLGAVDLYVTGVDGAVYFRRGWTEEEDTAEAWERVEAKEYDLAPGAPVEVAGGQLVARSVQGALWIRPRDAAAPWPTDWVLLHSPGFLIRDFAVAASGGDVLLAVSGPAGQVSIGRRRGAEPVGWRPIAAGDGWRAAPGAALALVSPDPSTVWVVSTGLDGTVLVASLDDPVWRPAGAAPGPATTPGVAAVSRVPGQVEIVAGRGDGNLAWTWWS